VANKARKGAEFEREVCKELSLWWMDGKRDDVFWRTSNSGGRATVRRKKSKSTFGQNSDVQAIDPIGQPLIDVMLLELKCGYSESSFIDWFDGKGHVWLDWITKIEEEAFESGTPYWGIVWKRKYKKATVTMPLLFYNEIRIGCGYPKSEVPVFRISLPLPHPHVVVMKLEDWLQWVRPSRIIELR